MPQNFGVTAQWDAEASVWVATSDQVVGLVTEAPTLDALYARILAVVPELLEENGVSASEESVIDLHVLSSPHLSAAE